MAIWKKGKSEEQVAKDLLRRYLIRCHGKIAEQYPEVAAMDPVNAADFLIHLRDAGRIGIELFNEGASSIGCKITDIQSE